MKGYVHEAVCWNNNEINDTIILSTWFLKGFSKINNSTGQYSGYNEDLKCDNAAGESQKRAFCNSPTWISAARRSQIFSTFSKRPVTKDTVVIPAGGYAVIRFKADNPGMR